MPEASVVPRLGLGLDFKAAGVLFCFAAVLGMAYTATWGGKAQFLQGIFAPAVMWACGEGFVNPMASETPELLAFLEGETAAFDCATLPGDLRTLPMDTRGRTREEVAAFHPHWDFPGWVPAQRAHQYLLMSAALCWRVLGVSWSNLLPLYGLLYGASAALTYGLFRLGMGRLLSVLLSVMLLTSPIQLQHLPHLRDYAKAPFILGLLLLLGLLVSRRWTRRGSLALAAGTGLTLGIGLGFRQDLLVFLPLALFLFACFPPGQVRGDWLWRCAGASLLLLIAGATAYPMLRVWEQSGNTRLQAMLGETAYCDGRLGIGTPLYDFGDPFKDALVYSAPVSYGERIQHTEVEVYSYSPSLESAARGLFEERCRVFPADVLFPAYASVVRVLDELKMPASEPAPPGITHPVLERAWAVHGWIARHFASHVRYAAILALLLLAARDLRLALACALMLAYVLGYPGIRFNLRHCFHLEFVGYWVNGFLLQCLLGGIGTVYKVRFRRDGDGTVHEGQSLWGRDGEGTVHKGQSLRMLCFAAVACLAGLLPMGLLRVYQHYSVGQLIERYLALPREPLGIAGTGGLGDGRVRIAFHDFANARGDAGGEVFAKTEYLVLAFRGEGPLDAVLRFEPGDYDHDLSRDLHVVRRAGGDGVTYVYCPVYYNEKQRFQGVELDAGGLADFAGAYRVADLSGCRVLPTLYLPPDWRTLPRYKELLR